MRQVRPHWLSPSATTKTPNVVVIFDTETAEVDEGDHTVQRLRCWDALVRVRRPAERRQRSATFFQGETAAELTDCVELASGIDRETWVIAHNVGFDLSVTSLPFILAERGWAVDSVHLGDESCWWVLTRDNKRLVITDSWSWVRCPLSEVAKDVGRRKTRLPDDADTLAAWHRRCKHDVVILDQAMATIMDWWDDNELGSFGITGAACGWRTLRKHIPPKSILVGPDGARTAFERRAVFGGRKEVYGVGEFHDTWISDFDFTAAYATTAAAHQLPSMPAKRWTSADELLGTDLPPRRDYIALVEVTTRRPCAPCRIDGEVWWPVGTFRTVLAGPEVRYCAEVADSVRVIDWQPYKMGYALADWAGWCLLTHMASADEVPPVVARMAKNWGRSVIGRFAARTSRVVATRPSTHLGWHLETGHDLDTGTALEWLTIGGVEQTIAKDLDASDVFPAVLAFVEAHTRVALARMLDSRPPGHLLQCNTDGWWEMRTVATSNYTPPDVPWPFTVTRKALERRLIVRGPNHVMTPTERRFAGIPRNATTDDGRIMRWHDWPGMRWQLEHGEQGQYHRPQREAALSDHYVRRWVLESGETIPVTTDVLADGSTVVLPWSRAWGRRESDELASYQVPTLALLNEHDTEPELRVHPILPDQPGRGFVYRPRAVYPKPGRDPRGYLMPEPEHQPHLFHRSPP